MKTQIFKTTITFLALMSSSISQATSLDVAWAQTPLWQAPYSKTASVYFDSNNSELKEECAYFTSRVLGKNGEVLVWGKSQLDNLRTLGIKPRQGVTFSALVKLNVEADMNILTSQMQEQLNAILENPASEGPKSLPQKTAAVVLDVSTMTQPLVSYQPNSLTKISESFALKPMPTKYVQKPDGLYLNFFGRDTMCDVLFKTATLNLNSSARVKISLDDQVKLTNLYTEVGTIVKNNFKRYTTVRSRAAAIGLQVGNLLEKSGEKNVPDKIASLMDFLFTDDKLTLSQVWSKTSEIKITTPDGTSQAYPIQLVIQTF